MVLTLGVANFGLSLSPNDWENLRENSWVKFAVRHIIKIKQNTLSEKVESSIHAGGTKT